VLATGPRRSRKVPLLARLAQTESILEDIYDRLSERTDTQGDLGSAGEWLLDNYYVVQEHIREIRQTLPKGYYRELPELAEGHLAGYPRIYELATTLISHTEGRIDLDNIGLFVEAFQSTAPLKLGELWAIPAVLRLGLIENVRRMALRTVRRLDDITEADRRINRIRAADNRGQLMAELGNLSGDSFALTSAFSSRLLHQLNREQDESPLRRAMEQWARDNGLSTDEADARARQHLVLTQVITANNILSLRGLARMDWQTFVESQSAMEAVLRSDPSGIYPGMTFGTRDQYRHVVEQIARKTGKSEVHVARRAIVLCGSDEKRGADSRRSHVGFYLIDEGRPELYAATGYRQPLAARVFRHPETVFFGGIVLVTAVVLAAILWLIQAPSLSWALFACALALIPATEVAVGVVNQLVALLVPPAKLPRLDFESTGGIPDAFRTTVVVPTLLDSVNSVVDAVENLEVQYLANRDANLHYALLSDFVDATAETEDADDAILTAAIEGVRELNNRYSAGAKDVFFLFHRSRQWNAQEGVWMGWERKRGKLAQFNRFLRGETGAFSTIVGDTTVLQSIRYVITLDADTVLPPVAVPLLVGTLAHPLNQAVYDADSGRVVRGYGILQPRVGVSLPSAHRSRFAAIHARDPGLDPYSTATSDVYQDLFGEGSFTGKGIYDVDVFEQATRGRFPENALLSHDLIEGSYARAGLVTDVIVYDDYPARYLTYTRRKQRWIRGDWQILGWLRSSVPGPEGREPNRLSLLSRWKILDNLRRSLIEISLVVLLIAGWTILPGGPLTWSAIVLGLIAAPSILWSVQSLLRPPFDKSWRAYYAAIGRDGLNTARQLAMTVTFLAHQAVISADAIVRTIWRLSVSRRKLLEWQTASAAERSTADSSGSVWRAMRSSTILAVAVLVGVAGLAFALSDGMSGTDGDRFTELHWLMAALPFVVLWLVGPAIAHHLRRPTGLPQKELSEHDRREALRYALLHWHYFDRFVTEDTHWLAPDNFQEDPSPVVAMRTSPTNIGLQLLATTSACDLGFITIEEMTSRLERVFNSLEGMRRFRGHFYNWYDLRDLSLLDPAYVSTVDSGNLAGHLIALRQACLTIPDTSVYDGRAERAVAAALSIAEVRLKRNSLKKAERLARDAHALLVPSTGEADLLAALVAVEQALDETRRAGFTDDSEVSEWLAWGLSRIEIILTDGFRSEASGPATSLRSMADNSEHASELVARMEAIAFEATRYIQEMDFRFLFDADRKLFSIGYNERGHALDASSYDLLASEARLTSFVAVAKKDVPVEHWFSLGRTLTHASGETALVSWSGSMFEYLMPALVMRSFPGTLLRQAYGGAVRRQIAYGRVAGVPWGSSESAYNLRDRHLTYQYRAFGVPDLALKRGLARDLVIAPYASALAMMVEPHRGLQNLATLEDTGALGRYGFYDALDYTRPDPGQRFAIVRNYMAHHVGMGLVALTNVLSEDVWPARFHLDPLVRAAELLLYERIPSRLVLTSPLDASSSEALPDPDLEQPFVRVVDTPHTSEPRVALLGRLPYTIMVTSGGGGYSRYENLAVTRWKPDGTTDDTGQFCYVKDVASGRVWSCAHQPIGVPADEYEARLATDRVSFHRVDGDIQTDTEIAVLPEDSAEVRRVTVTNTGRVAREIEVTSYAEIVLAEPAADAAHPAFSNLFVETEWHEWCTAITATRRPRSSDEPSLWCVHVVDAGKSHVGEVTYETDRSRFIGRGRSVRFPLATEHEAVLSGTTGAVLDPIFALRVRLHLEPGKSGSAAFTTLVAPTRAQAFELADRYHDSHAAQRALELAWASTQVELRELAISPSDAAIFQDLAGRMIFPLALDSPSLDERSRQRGSQPALWSIGISGDRPILLATIKSPSGLRTLRQLLTAHRYWRRRGLMVDLVIVNAHPPSYLQELHDSIVGMLHALHDSDQIDRPGGIFIRRLADLGSDALAMLRTSAPVHVICDGRSIADLFPDFDSVVAARRKDTRRKHSSLLPVASNSKPAPTNGQQPGNIEIVRATGPATEASAPNGFGSLLPDDSYALWVRGDHVPPAPWANVIANEHGGFIVSERGAGSTWADSSYFFRLTPWHNDPVADPPGEVLYLRDEDKRTFGAQLRPPSVMRSNTRYGTVQVSARSPMSMRGSGVRLRWR
jgi:cyclic beta-1,2-glucan synthetase